MMTKPCIVLTLFCTLLLGCESDTGYPSPGGPDVNEAFSDDAKPVGDPSRETHPPEHAGPAIQIPAGAAPESMRSSPNAPAPQLKDQ